MKNLLYGLCTVLSVFLIASCEKEYSLELGNPPGGGPGSFRAQVDGAQWVAAQAKSASRLNGVIMLSGSAGDGTSITMRVKDSGVHVYKFHNTSQNNWAHYMDSAIVPVGPYSTDQWLVDSIYGELTISTIDTVRMVMSGSFHFKAFRTDNSTSVTITSGQFTNISYGVPVTPPPVAEDTFRVKIDGVDFNYSSFMAMENFGQLNLTAMDGSGKTVSLLMSSTIAPGNHTLTAGLPSAMYFPAATTMYETITGVLNIESNNTATGRIRGTFNFESNDATTPLPANVVLSDGFFSVSY